MKLDFIESMPWTQNNTHHILPPEVLARALFSADSSSSSSSSSSSTFSSITSAAIQDHSLVTRNIKPLPLETKQFTRPSLSSQKYHAQILPQTPPHSPFAAEIPKPAEFDRPDLRDQIFDLGNGQFSWASDSYQPSSKKRRTPVTPAPKPYDSKVPRPPNAFIIYHRTKSKQLAAIKSMRAGSEERHPSKTVAEMWREESDEVKLRYQREADLALVEHKKKYPFYKYKPQKRDSKTKGKARDDKPCSFIESDSPKSSKAIKSQVPDEHRQQAAMESAFTVFDLPPLETTKIELSSNDVGSTPQIANTRISQDSKLNLTTEKIESHQNVNASIVSNNDLKISIDQIPIIDQNANQPRLWIEANVNNLYSSPVEEVEQFSFEYPQLQSSQSSAPAIAFPSTVSLGGNNATSAYASPSPSPTEQRDLNSFSPNAVTPMQHQMQDIMLVENEYMLNQMFNQTPINNESTYFESSTNFADQDLKPISITTPTTGNSPNHSLLTPSVEPIEFTSYEQPLTNAPNTSDQSCNINYNQNNWIMNPSLPTSPTTLDFWPTQLTPFDINTIPTATLRETQRQIQRLLEVRENTQKQIQRICQDQEIQNAHLYDICCPIVSEKDQFVSNFSF
jgi:hypothetical protein